MIASGARRHSSLESIAGAALVAILAASACQANTPEPSGNVSPSRPPTSASPSTGPSASPSPAPVARICGPQTTPCLALVILRNSDHLVVRDLTDFNNIHTVADLGSVYIQETLAERSLGQFVDGSSVAIPDGPTDGSFHTDISLFPLGGGQKRTVVQSKRGILAFAWSPGGSTVSYLSTEGGEPIELHQWRSGVDRLLDTLPKYAIIGCDCPEYTYNEDVRLAYSRDGAYLAAGVSGITGNSGSYIRIWKPNGDVAAKIETDSPTMSVWAGDDLYFHDSHGIRVWHDGAVSTYLSGLSWTRPKSSPDGTRIVYAGFDPQGRSHVYLLTLATKRILDLGDTIIEPTFLTSRYVWFETEAACQAARTCRPRVPSIAAGLTHIYDIPTGRKIDSIVTFVEDVWPPQG